MIVRGSAACWVALATVACAVPGLEIGPGQGGSAGEAAGGSGGAGGSSEVRCEDLPIPPKATWEVAAFSASLGTGDAEDPLNNPARNAVDDRLDDRWASGQPQQAGQWFHVDFGATVALSEVTLRQGPHLDDYPRGYAISLSYRHTDFDAVASVSGQGASVSEAVIPLGERAVGRYMMIQQTGEAEKWWTIAELDVACH